MIDIKKEFKKISNSFQFVKKDILEIKDRINKYQKEESYEIAKLKDEIAFLRNVIYNIQTAEEIKIPSKKEIIGNKSSLKFHYSDCPFSKKINQEHKIIFSSVNEAIKKGYSRCTCIE